MQFESNKIEDYATFFFNLNNLNIILWKKSFIHVVLQSMGMNKNVSLSCGPSNKKILSVIILTGVTKKWLFLYFADVIELLMCLGSGSLKTMFFLSAMILCSYSQTRRAFILLLHWFYIEQMLHNPQFCVLEQKTVPLSLVLIGSSNRFEWIYQ